MPCTSPRSLHSRRGSYASLHSPVASQFAVECTLERIESCKCLQCASTASRDLDPFGTAARNPAVSSTVPMVWLFECLLAGKRAWVRWEVVGMFWRLPAI